ncbi:membrane protein insertion efficiency factor YidD [Candidatus Poribacteria bacterium]|jgi:uncharacterized protein|nr:membrane protein insertion efficiency factor YidD [Candidatus Poribacteria bacterium]MBT5533648.1 membrane protein insertion efficiency factor YidD [Candidatus Poribacteria bacterium]MBT5713530.1 membrane protein insertion efficiency factor YidD [Candidatus Poribacteria bacterium]MBT7101454.1 membrane protein insertion efficiency factor YidD [Candidatus Poribacteria bacterium]MBT7806214.1 membrane protein insertion efficiency factor YidD [Candidatus Poribacteria bacterium]
MSAVTLVRSRSRRSAIAISALALVATVCAAVEAGPGHTTDAILSRIQAEPLAPRPPRLQGGSPTPTPRESGASSPFLLLPVWVHQTLISPQDGDRCVFSPSCSEYAAQALKSRGPAGWPVASDRILRCHHGAHGSYPSEGGYALDPVREPAATRLSIAGGLASLVPGLGQLVAGDRVDAMYALGTVSLLAWGASRYARREQIAPAAALGGLGVFFYVGAVYGGARAVGRASRP